MSPRYRRPLPALARRMTGAILLLVPATMPGPAALLGPTVLHAQEGVAPDPDAPVFTHPLPGPKYADALIPVGSASALPRVVANDNRTDAGGVVDGVRVVELEVVLADWRIESEAGPGLRVPAIAEVGGTPMIPAPVIRADAGSRIRVTLHNRLDHQVQVFGLRDRPYEGFPADEVAAGETLEVEFDAGAAGTFFYSVFPGPHPDSLGDVELPEREQAAGALVVEDPGTPREDRLLVINVFGEPVTEALHPNGYLEALAINGRSWPYTELVEMEVGREERWRVVNASVREHPMHLHGFFFDVEARGSGGGDEVYGPDDVRSVVTETMLPFTTMSMRWTPTRPGRWLFHCHLTFHVSNAIRLPGAVEADPEHAHSHMAGLAMGIDVAAGPTDLVRVGDPVEVELHTRVIGDERGRRYGVMSDHAEIPLDSVPTPGTLLVFEQHQAADVTVHNDLPGPTAIHWHGLELDAWADGVPGWSASDGRVSPAIPSGESFTYRLSLMRAGTFMYHTHLDDVDQLTGGIYGPLIVLPPGESFDPEHDHPRLFAWREPNPSGPEGGEVNGRRTLADAETRVGETHRFRVMNIAPASMISAWVLRDGAPTPIRLHAKDGSDLPASQQLEVDALPRIGPGETADFLWVPTEPGEYRVLIGYAPDDAAAFGQRWIVR